jgi:hypothetical protein
MKGYLSLGAVALLALAVAGCNGKGSSGGTTKSSGKYRDVVAKCVRLMAVDLEAVKDKHVGLAGWDMPAPGARSIDHASKGGGIRITVSRPAEKKAEHEFPNLGLAVFVEVDGEKKFVRAVKEIVAGRLVPLRDLNAAVGKSMKGVVADLNAIKAKHPELVGFSTAAHKGSRLEYSTAAFGLSMWVELQPQSVRTQQCFPLHATVKGGSRELRTAVLASVEKNVEPLRELERRTGGWQAK